MNENLIKMTETAIQATKDWTVKGWPTTFGPRKTSVNNLETAKKLPHTDVYRLEAIAYWERVKNSADDILVWGERCLASLKKGDVQDAFDAAYFAVFIEKPIREIAPTWEGVMKALMAAKG